MYFSFILNFNSFQYEIKWNINRFFDNLLNEHKKSLFYILLMKNLKDGKVNNDEELEFFCEIENINDKLLNSF